MDKAGVKTAFAAAGLSRLLKDIDFISKTSIRLYTTPADELHVALGTSRVGGIPDTACTPGDILPSGTKAAICEPGYAQGVRNVPVSEKNRAYAEYGVKRHTPGQYEVDHLVSLELGGSNAISNLWPELASPKPGFHEKDKVENYLHNQVCSGAISLKQAQIEIATNWLAVYNRMRHK